MANRISDTTSDHRLPRFAVLIDADNTSPRIAEGLFEEVAKFGRGQRSPHLRRFLQSALKSWTEILQRFAIDPYQQFAYHHGQERIRHRAGDRCDGLLHSGRFDGFCLVSSDSDFTRLASRLREQGADVYGFGAQKTPESFRQACRRFIYTENLLPETQASGPEPAVEVAIAGTAERRHPHSQQSRPLKWRAKTAGFACATWANSCRTWFLILTSVPMASAS
jgi:hypothetical protein